MRILEYLNSWSYILLQIFTKVYIRFRYVSQLQAKRASLYEAKVRKNRTSSSRTPPRPAYTDVFDAKGGNPYRFMCVVRLPWLDRSRGRVEWGLSCSGCRDKFHDRTDGKLDWRWQYTISGYILHFRQCRKSIELLESLVWRREYNHLSRSFKSCVNWIIAGHRRYID